MKDTKTYIWLGLIGLTIWVMIFPDVDLSQRQVELGVAQRVDFAIDVATLGELETTRSNIVSSSLNGDQAKIVYIIDDGSSVKKGDVLIRFDMGFYKDKLEELLKKSHEQEDQIASCEKALLWEKEQEALEWANALAECSYAEKENEMFLKAEHPHELARLEALLRKAEEKYEDSLSYLTDLEDLQLKGFLHPQEIKVVKRKIQEEKEAYDAANLEYTSYVDYTYPLKESKMSMGVQKAKNHLEEVKKNSHYKVGKAEQALVLAKWALEDLRAQSERAKRDLANCTLYAPTDGMVVLREEYHSGQRRKPRIGDLVIKNQPLLDLPDLSAMQVKTRVREKDLHQISLGKQVTIEVDAYPKKQFLGTVMQIGVLGQKEVGVMGEEKAFEVKVLLSESDQNLRPGMTARLVIHAKNPQETLVVPSQAIFEEEGANFVYMKNQTKKKVSLGAVNELYAEVSSGLKEGDQVWLIQPGGP